MNYHKLIFAAVLLLAAISCKKSSPSNTVTVSNAEAANLATGSLLYGSSGVMTTFIDAIDVSSSLSLNINSTTTALVRNKINTKFSAGGSSNSALGLECGKSYQDAVFREGTVGSADAFSYQTTYNITLNCSNSTPDNITGSATFNGNYIGIYATAADTGSSNFTVSGLAPADTTLIMTGTYTRHGVFKSTIDTSNHGTYSVSITITKLIELKSTVHTTNDYFGGGTATITITGNVPKKGNFNYTGTLVFDGVDLFTATLTLNGQVYTVHLDTGVISPKG